MASRSLSEARLSRRSCHRVTGALDLYLINRAVYWWRGIHTAVIVTKEGPSGLQDPRMQLALIACLIAFFLLFLWLLRLRVRYSQLESTAEDLRHQLARA